jgi:hypothetical protein
MSALHTTLNILDELTYAIEKQNYSSICNTDIYKDISNLNQEQILFTGYCVNFDCGCIFYKDMDFIKYFPQLKHIYWNSGLNALTLYNQHGEILFEYKFEDNYSSIILGKFKYRLEDVRIWI